jgi:hypothetical protein
MGLWEVAVNAAITQPFGRRRFPQYNSSEMATGDAQRVWFPEMIERLRVQWHRGMSCDALIALRDELDAQLQRIRSERRIHSPIFKCPCCGHIGEGADPRVSVRAMILSLGRFGIASAAQTSAIEKRWATHRKQHGLDLDGKSIVALHAASPVCAHRGHSIS